MVRVAVPSGLLASVKAAVRSGPVPEEGTGAGTGPGAGAGLSALVRPRATAVLAAAPAADRLPGHGCGVEVKEDPQCDHLTLPLRQASYRGEQGAIQASAGDSVKPFGNGQIVIR